MAEVDIELEKVDEEEFDFVSSVLLDGVNSLRCKLFGLIIITPAELDGVKKGLAARKNNGIYVPLSVLKRQRSVSVSDISGGLWCEVQMEYQHLHPWLRETREWRKRSAEGRPVNRKTETMKEGSSVHLKKGLHYLG